MNLVEKLKQRCINGAPICTGQDQTADYILGVERPTYVFGGDAQPQTLRV